MTCANPAAGSRPPRTPTPPAPTATTTRGCSTRGRPPRSPTCSAPTRRPCASSTTSPRPATSRTDRSPTASAGGPASGSGRRRSRRPASRCSRPGSCAARPGLDDKVLTEWNALMIASLAEAGALLGEPGVDRRRGRAPPTSCAPSCAPTTGGGGGPGTRSAEPRARHDALAADHAALVDAFVRLAEATGEASWIAEAVATADTMLEHFWDAEQGGLFTTPRRRRATDRAPEGRLRQRHPVGQLDRGRRAAAPRRAHRGAIATPTTPSGSSSCSPRSCRALRAASPTSSAPSPCAPAASPRSPSPAIARTSSTSCASAGARGSCSRGASATTHRSGRSRRDGLAYVCEHYACQAPASTPDELRAQL